MDFIGFGLLCIFMGYNWFSRRSWWAAQASKSWVVFKKKTLEQLFAATAFFAILMGIFFICVGTIAMCTGRRLI